MIMMIRIITKYHYNFIFFIIQAFGFCTFEYGNSALRCKNILSEINFSNPINSIKKILNHNKKISKNALKNVLKVIKSEQKIINKKIKKEERDEREKQKIIELEMKIKNDEDKNKNENENENENENDLTFILDTVGSNIKKEIKDENGNMILIKTEENNVDSKKEAEGEGEKIKVEIEIKTENPHIKKEDEKIGEKEEIEEEEEEEEVEEEEEEEEQENDDEEDSSVPGMFLEIKAGSKEQTVLDSLDQVRTCVLPYK